MNSRERVVTALGHREPDRIPFFELEIDDEIGSKIIGRDLIQYNRTYNFKYELFKYFAEKKEINKEFVLRSVKSTCDLYNYLDMDIIPIRIYSSFVSLFFFCYMGLTDSFDDINVSQKNNEWLVKNSEGFWSLFNFNKDNNSISIVDDSINKIGIKELKRFNKFARNKIDNFSLRMNKSKKAYMSDKNTYSQLFPGQIQISLDAIKYALELNSKERFILGYGSLCYPTNAMFHTLFLELMILNPKLVFEYMELTTEGILPLIEAQLKLGVDGIICVNDYAYNTGPIFSPKHFRQFLVPFYKKIADLCHKYKRPYIKHCDGNINELIDLFINDCEFDGVHAIEPSSGMDIYDLKKRYGERITLFGNLDCSNLLIHGSSKDIESEIARLKENISGGGGYIFSSSNSIHRGIPLKNFKIMIDTFYDLR